MLCWLRDGFALSSIRAVTSQASAFSRRISADKPQDILLAAAPEPPEGGTRGAQRRYVTTSLPSACRLVARRSAYCRVSSTPDDFGPAISDAKAAVAAAINVLATPLFSFSRGLLIERAAKLRLPAIYKWPALADEGGLMELRHASRYDRPSGGTHLLKANLAEKPADIPVDQPTSFRVCNPPPAAKAIEFTVPQKLSHAPMR